jgi:hypothetical protein
MAPGPLSKERSAEARRVELETLKAVKRRDDRNYRFPDLRFAQYLRMRSATAFR